MARQTKVKTEMLARGWTHEGTGGGCESFFSPPGSRYQYLLNEDRWGSQVPTRMTGEPVYVSKTLLGECESEAEKHFPSVAAFLKWWDAGNRL